MTAALLLINNERITLADDADLPALIAAIMTALDHGGAFVHIDGGRGDQYDVLITEGTQIIVRHGSASVEIVAPDGPWNSSIDLDI
ncbi:MAG: hypothetical protein B7Y93_07770 [Micrococcales bacterium 32-70-13]|jgi:hypothetical protein|nr:MAG: hypothetical protein B7Y93_07770 [Micrococcales bacterium 32-70-13]